jgi:hypothetical protein
MVTRSSLTPGQRQTREIIHKLGFGRIEGLTIRHGEPRFEKPPRIVQEIKLSSEPEGGGVRGGADFTLKNDFDRLFNQLDGLCDGLVDIEVKHRLPFRLVLERRYEDWL